VVESVVRDAVVEGGRDAGCGSCGVEAMWIVRGVERVRARVGRRKRGAKSWEGRMIDGSWGWCAKGCL